MGKLPANVLSVAKVGKHSDGGGLTLLIKSRGEDRKPKGSWIYRYTFHGKRYEMGLGSVERLSLKNARDEVERYNDMITDKRTPVNPIEERERLADVRTAVQN